MRWTFYCEPDELPQTHVHRTSATSAARGRKPTFRPVLAGFTPAGQLTRTGAASRG